MCESAEQLEDVVASILARRDLPGFWDGKLNIVRGGVNGRRRLERGYKFYSLQDCDDLGEGSFSYLVKL